MQPREREYADHNHRFTGETLEEETRERQCSFYRGKRVFDRDSMQRKFTSKKTN